MCCRCVLKWEQYSAQENMAERERGHKKQDKDNKDNKRPQQEKQGKQRLVQLTLTRD